jgi:hypothetical protein
MTAPARHPAGLLAAALAAALLALLWPGPPPGAQQPAPGAAAPPGPDLGGLTFKPPDDRLWIVGDHAGNDSGLVVEFVVAGESKDDWTELVTMQAYKVAEGEFPPPEKAAELLENRMRARCPTAEWEVLDSKPESVLYRWRTAACPPHPDESEMARILALPDTTVRIAYTTRKGPIPAADRARLRAWLEGFSTAAAR